MTRARAATVYGRGFTARSEGIADTVHDVSIHHPICHTCTRGAVKPTTARPASPVGPPSPGMATYDVSAMLVSLRITDTPMDYTPPVGPAVPLTLTYNQRDMTQPANFTYGNVGPQWTLNWAAYIEDDPGQPGANVRRMPGGGGAVNESGYDAATGTFAPEALTGAVLRRSGRNTPIRVPLGLLLPPGGLASLGGPGTTYTLTRPDGSQAVYSQQDGNQVYPRRIFLTAVIDPQGNPLTLHYDPNLRLTAITDALGQSTTFQYGNPGGTGSLSNPTFATLVYTPTPPPLTLIGVTDPFGRHVTLGYDAEGRLNRITDVMGLTSSFTYGGATAGGLPNNSAWYWQSLGRRGRRHPTPPTVSPIVPVVAIYYPPPPPLSPPPGSADFINSMTTAYGTSTFAYGENGTERWLTATDPDGGTEQVEFSNQAPVPAGEVAPAGMSTSNGLLAYRNTFYWDRNASAQSPGDYTTATVFHWAHETGAPVETTSRVLESFKTPLTNRVWYDYPGSPASDLSGTFDRPSAIGQVLGDGSSAVRTQTYNAAGRTTWFEDPAGRQTFIQYAANGIDRTAVAQRTAQGGQDLLMQATYNRQHEPLSVTDAAGATTRYTYNGFGERTSRTNALGQTTTYEYSPQGYLADIRNPQGQVQAAYTYDGLGRIATYTDAGGETVGLTYDALNRLTAIQYPDGTTTTFGYNRLDLAQVTNRLGATTTYGYNAERMLLSITDALNQTTTLQYDADGGLVQRTDPEGNGTFYTRDLEDRRVSRIRADGTSTTYGYGSGAGRLATVTDALGQTTAYTYTIDSHLAGITYDNAQQLTPNVTFTWDPSYARVRAMQDGTGTTTYTYGAVGSPGALALTAVVPATTGDPITWTYDALGRPKTRTLDNQTERWRYDALGRIVGDTNALGTFHFAYLGATDQVTTQRLGGSPVTVQYRYAGNLHDRALRAITTGLGSGAQGFGAGRFGGTPPALAFLRRVLARVSQTPSGTPGALTPLFGLTQTTDPAGEVVRRTPNGQTPTTYTYDADQHLVGTTTGSAVRSYTYDATGNLTDIAGIPNFTASYNALNAPIATNQTALGYDVDGQRLDAGPRTYLWDAAHRLIAVTNTQTQQTVTYTYNGLGQRVTRTGTATTLYVFCGGPTPCAAHSGTNAPEALWYPEGAVSAGQIQLYARGPRGSVHALVSPQGQVLDRWIYSPYGTSTRTQGPPQPLVPFRYAGMFQDPATGLSLTPYRAYDPALRTWLSPDPIGWAGSALWTHLGLR